MIKLIKPLVTNVATRIGTAVSLFLIGRGIPADEAAAVETGIIIGLAIIYDFVAQFIVDQKRSKV